MKVFIRKNLSVLLMVGWCWAAVSPLHSSEVQALDKDKSTVLTSVPAQPTLPPYLEMSGMAQFNLAIYQLMKDVDAAFKRAGASYAVIFGTLLGATRHGGLIPWDDDIDIVVTDTQMALMPRVIEILKKSGYRAVNCSELGVWDPGWSGWRVERRFDMPEITGKKRVACCDVFLLEKKGDHYVYPRGNWKRYPIAEEVIYPLRNQKFGALNVLIPNKYQELLDKDYGPSWPTKMKKYNHYGFVANTATLEDMQPMDYLPAGPFGPLEERVRDE